MSSRKRALRSRGWSSLLDGRAWLKMIKQKAKNASHPAWSALCVFSDQDLTFFEGLGTRQLPFVARDYNSSIISTKTIGQTTQMD